VENEYSENPQMFFTFTIFKPFRISPLYSDELGGGPQFILMDHANTSLMNMKPGNIVYFATVGQSLPS
jgi:hypothetical protein